MPWWGCISPEEAFIFIDRKASHKAAGSLGSPPILGAQVPCATQDVRSVKEVTQFSTSPVTSHKASSHSHGKLHMACLELTVLVAFGHVLRIQGMIELIGRTSKQLLRVVANQFCDSAKKSTSHEWNKDWGRAHRQGPEVGGNLRTKTKCMHLEEWNPDCLAVPFI